MRWLSRASRTSRSMMSWWTTPCRRPNCCVRLHGSTRRESTFWGFSLGGVAAPRIAQRDPAIAGLIFYSAPTGMFVEGHRSDQAQRRVEADGDISASDERWLDIAQARVAAMEAMAAGSPAPHMNVRPSHFLDRADYLTGGRRSRLADSNADPPRFRTTKSLSDDDIVGWAASLHRRDDVVFRLYREHTHALFDRRPRSGPDLRPEAHVGSEVISDIASWVAGERPAQACVDLQAWHAGCRGGPNVSFGCRLTHDLPPAAAPSRCSHS